MKECPMGFTRLLNRVTSLWKEARKNFPSSAYSNALISFFSTLQSLFILLFSSKAKKIQKRAARLESALDAFEGSPLLFAGQGCMTDPTQALELLEKATALIEEGQAAKDETVVKPLKSLKRKSVALMYRMEKRPPAVSIKVCNRLRGKVSLWKSAEKSIECPDLDSKDIMAIQTTSSYPYFAEQLLQDDELFNEWAIFTIRDKVDPAVLIEFPALAKKLVDCNLSSRIGRLGGLLKIEYKPIFHTVEQKIVTLPFEGKPVNILEQNAQVDLSSNYSLTVGEAFEVFRNKNYRVGNLEYLSGGITNWNVHKWGRWNPLRCDYDLINFSHPEWWWLLPNFEVIERREVEERYEVELKEGQWCAAATATSLSKTLDYENTHAFLEIAIPLGDGRYNILDFGKFATVFPSSFFEAVSMFCHNLHATVSFPDENIFYLHRARAYQPFVMDETKGKHLMDLIRKDMVRGMEKNFVYQIESDNCAKWVHDLLTHVLGESQVPEMFKIHLLDTEPTSFVAHIFSAIKLLPEKWQTAVMTFFHIPMGAFKTTWIFEKGKLVAKSLTKHEFWDSGIVYLPALLLKLKEMGLLGFINQIGIGTLYTIPGSALRYCFNTLRGIRSAFTRLSNPHITRRKRLDQLRDLELIALRS